MPEDRDLDRLIDAALGTYADPPQDANLAARILTRLANNAAPQPRFRWLLWPTVALPVAICLLLLIHSGPGITKPSTTPPIQSAQLRSPDSISERPRMRVIRSSETARQATRTGGRAHRLTAATAPQPLPKLDVFPTPTPMSSQERVLAACVEHAPQAEQQALAQSEHKQTPLTLASVQTIPLDALDELTITN